MPFVQVADMEDNKFNLVSITKQRISQLAMPKSVFVPEGTILVSLQGTIGRVAITQYDSYVDRTIAIFTHIDNEVDIRYFAYQLKRIFGIKKENARGSTIKTITKEEFGTFQIPLPPLSVQQEIVRILDKFTQLEAELDCRKRQYEYYRNKLLTFNELENGGGTEIVWKTLGEVCINIFSGKNKDRNDNASYPIYGSTGIIGKTNKKAFSSKQILVARVGANAGYVHIAEGEYDVSDNALIIQHNENINLKFLYYILVNIKLNQYAKGGGQPLITARELKSIIIPLPPLEEQQRIATILDKFDTFVNSISEGLPKEIALRRKQYEYYREKLLTFPS